MAEFKNRAPFQDCIDEHDANIRALWSWRLTLERFAADLAGQIPLWTKGHSNVLPEKALKSAPTIEKRIKDWKRHAPNDAFDPWDGWWAGRWKNKDVNLHIWDKTQSGRQLVSQLQAGPGLWFAHNGNIAKLKGDGKVDIALNAVASRDGLTGWVQKRQKDNVTLPHIAFLLSPTCLIWIARIYGRTAEKMTIDPFAAPKDYNPSKFFCFVEQTNGLNASMYTITGFEFWIAHDPKKHFATKAVPSVGEVKYLNGGAFTPVAAKDWHYGRYHKIKPFRTRAAAAADPAAKSGMLKTVLERTAPAKRPKAAP